MKNKYRFNIRFIIEVSIYEIIDINESIKNLKDKKFKGVNKGILKESGFLI